MKSSHALHAPHFVSRELAGMVNQFAAADNSQPSSFIIGGRLMLAFALALWSLNGRYAGKAEPGSVDR
jgi:hypothetical protein